jgi:hypothetical protein
MESKFVDYKVKVKLGTIGHMATEWWTQEDWDKHAEYVEKLKAEGNYLKEEEFTISLIPCPIFDNVQSIPTDKNKYSFKFLNFSNGKAEC